jgi:hypothetical protein
VFVLFAFAGMYILPVQPLASTHAQSSDVFPRSTSDPQCGFEGNNDIYGIGIRIGVYAQILAVWFANYFLFSEAQVLRDSVSIFSVALLIVALLYAASPQDVFAVEGFVLLQILAWSCIMGVRAKSSYSKGIFSRGSLIRKLVCEIVNLVNIGLHVWFWWVGVEQMKKTPCGTYMMMYVLKTGMLGWARKVMMAMSLFVLCCTIYWASVELLRPWAMWKTCKSREEFVEAIKRWQETTFEQADSVENAQVLDKEDKDCGSVCACGNIGDACSKSSCPHCSPTKSHFRVDCTAMPDVQVPGELSKDQKTDQSASPRNSIDRLSYTLSHRPSSEHQTPRVHPEPAILQEVYESELYIQHCVSASPYQMSADGKPLALPIIIKSILFPSRYRSTNTTNNPPSWFRCHLLTWRLFFACRFPPQAFVVYSHLRQTRLLDPLNGPFQLYAAVKYKSARGGELPKWSSVSLASSLMVTAPETPKKAWLGWYYTILDLAIHIIVILQLELTLRWNHVSGLSDLWTSVGQLIPFIIGVGGLTLVGSRWGVRIWVKWKSNAGMSSGWEKSGLLDNTGVEDGQGEETFGLEESVREGYVRWRELHIAS